VWTFKALSLLLPVVVATSAGAVEQPIPDNPLIAIAGGRFIYGSDDGSANERPRRSIELKAFAINRTEITNAQYQRFVEATGHRSAYYGGHPMLGIDGRPVVGVSFGDAAAFCAHYGLRLPSEQEYERAARGTEGARFPWGDAAVDGARANHGSEICCGSDDSDGYAMTAPADSYPGGASKDGVLNLLGNVWEWTQDAYQGNGRHRVLRGGAWNSDPAHLTTTYRLAYDADFRFAANGGFRCARSSS
jgi:formylglycine-generating enzyme required for sulfatase activity